MNKRRQSPSAGEKESEQLILHGRVRRDPLGIGLLTVSAAGIALNGIVFPRLARLGGILQQVSTGILFGRAMVFTAAGVPYRLRLLPRILSFVELITDGVATVLGFAAWIWPGYAGRERSGSGWVAPASRIVSTITFALHTVRLAFYLSPSRGLRDGVRATETSRR